MANLDGPDFITLLVNDLERSYQFYAGELGLPESSEIQPNAHAFHTKPIAMAIRKAPEGFAASKKPGHGIILWLRASDSASLYAELKQKGVPIAEELHSSPFGMVFSFRDPDGYVISVHDRG